MTTNSRIELPEGKSWIEARQLPKPFECNAEIFKELLGLKPEERGKVKVYGKVFDVPRWTQTYGKDYFYSGINHKAIEIGHPFLKNLVAYTKIDTQKDHNQLLINWYLTGNDYISKHSDNERDMVNDSPIYSFSFGATRDFVITSKADKSFRLVLKLENNSVVIMGGEMQTYYYHEVPKRLKVKEPRINVTIRQFK